MVLGVGKVRSAKVDILSWTVVYVFDEVVVESPKLKAESY